MANNYKVVESFDSQKYAECLLIHEDICNASIWDIQVDSEWSDQELEYYQLLFETQLQSQTSDAFGLLMLVPIKQHVPYVAQWISFDFEVAMLDYR